MNTQNTEVPEQLRIHWSWMFKMPPWAFFSYVKNQLSVQRQWKKNQADQAIRKWESQVGQELKRSIQKYQENQPVKTSESAEKMEPTQTESINPVVQTQEPDAIDVRALFKHLLSSGDADDLDEFEYAQCNFHDFHSWVSSFEDTVVFVDVKLRNGRKYHLPGNWARSHKDWISYEANMRSFLKVHFHVGFSKLTVELDFSNVFIFKHHTENPTREEGKHFFYDEMLVCPGSREIPIEEISIRMTKIQEN